MSSRKLLPFVTRQFSTTVRRQADIVHPGYNQLKAAQDIFQKENGLPIHVKKGGFDMILYKFTLALSCFGVASSFFCYYKLATGQK